MGAANRPRRATRPEKRSARLRLRLGDGPLDLCLFALSAIKPPESPADLRLAMWRLQVGADILGRHARGELFCLVCEEPIRSRPAHFGFLKADLSLELCGFAICESCFEAAGTLEALPEMVASAFGATAAAPSLSG
jgi:hypothetical protein